MEPQTRAAMDWPQATDAAHYADVVKDGPTGTFTGPNMLGCANGDKFAGARFCVALGTKSCLYNATFFMLMTNAPNLMHTFTLLPF